MQHADDSYAIRQSLIEDHVISFREATQIFSQLRAGATAQGLCGDDCGVIDDGIDHAIRGDGVFLCNVEPDFFEVRLGLLR